VKKINLYYQKSPSPGNFGDILSSFILKKLGYSITDAKNSDSGKFICIGSTAKFIKRGDVVWGTGIMSDSDPVETNARYLAVRGPLTGKKVGCDVYGDPGLLCSHFWPLHARIQNKRKLGVIPHYVDYNKYNVEEHYQINLLNSNPIEVMRNIVKCESIVSSSLHGIIAAHSYGIPAGWWRPSDSLHGDDSKFKDYAMSVGIELQSRKDYKDVMMTLPSQEKIKQIQENLLNAIQSY
jgi:hypothetical protein